MFNDFDDTWRKAILQNVRKVMRRHEKLFLTDIIMDEGDAMHRGSTQDIFMLTQLGGRERTTPEFSRLLDQTGFETVSLSKTTCLVSILKLRPKD